MTNPPERQSTSGCINCTHLRHGANLPGPTARGRPASAARNARWSNCAKSKPSSRNSGRPCRAVASASSRSPRAVRAAARRPSTKPSKSEWNLSRRRAAKSRPVYQWRHRYRPPAASIPQGQQKAKFLGPRCTGAPSAYSLGSAGYRVNRPKQYDSATKSVPGNALRDDTKI